MYESPIDQVVSKISSEMKECEDKQLMCTIRQTIGYDIDKTELIKALRYDRQQYEKGYADGLNVNRWIPVSERLPEEGEDVLACFYIGEGNYKIMVSRRSDYNYWSGVGRTADMVAWMPLPEPCKAESEGEEWKKNFQMR